jgi:2-dehydropantoate 2-reductase
VKRIADFFERAGIAYVVPENMVRTLWYKFMINVGINQASAVLRAPYGLFQREPAAQRVMESAMAEVVALSKALGTGLVDGDIAAWYTTLRGLGADGLTSMAQDVLAGRQTEVEAFAGAVVEMGKRTGVPTPVNAVLRDLLAAVAAGS